MTRPPKARWVARADRLCTQTNDVLLAFALLLAVVVVSGQQHPRGFGDIVAHLDWLSPPMDPSTGILWEQAVAGVVDQALSDPPDAPAGPARGRH